jgi:CBS domain-containing protein
MSRRAAARLESFGFENVCVYAAGKQDWLAFNLPFEGKLAESHTAGTSAIQDIPVCGPTEKLSEVRRSIEKTAWRECVVVNENGVVLGLLKNHSSGAAGESPVVEAMDPAPLTFRPHSSCDSAIDKMRSQKTRIALVTNPDGKLIGILRDAETK